MWVQFFALVFLIVGIVLAVIPKADDADSGGKRRSASRSKGAAATRPKQRKKGGRKRVSGVPLEESRKVFASQLDLLLAGSSSTSLPKPNRKPVARLAEEKKETQKMLGDLFGQTGSGGQRAQAQTGQVGSEGSTVMGLSATVRSGDGEKYEKMRKAGVPEAAIEQAKMRDQAGMSNQLKPRDGKASASASKSKRSSKRRSSRRRSSTKRSSTKRSSKKRKRGFFANLFSSKKPEEEVVEEKKVTPASKGGNTSPVVSQKFQGNPLLQELSTRLPRRYDSDVSGNT